MADAYHTKTVREALDQLLNAGFSASATRTIRDSVAAISGQVVDRVVAEIPAFTESRNPQIVLSLKEHSAVYVGELCRLLERGAVGDFGFVGDYARHLVDHRFPLEATLHSYRCGHKVMSYCVRDAILAEAPDAGASQTVLTALADLIVEYVDALSTIFARAHVEQIRFLAEVATDQRTELLHILLDGYDESDGRVAGILRNAGYLDGRQVFCVGVSRSMDPAEMLNPARARRLADSIEESLAGTVARRVIDVRDNRVVFVLSDLGRISGFTQPGASLADRVATQLARLGPSVLVGISNDAPSTGLIPRAYREAELALEIADPTQRVTRFWDLPVRRLLMFFGRENIQVVLPSWTSAFIAADEKLGGKLIRTLRAYAEADMNVLKAAEHLSIHPNTIYSRFQRIQEITDLQPRSFASLGELLLVADISR